MNIYIFGNGNISFSDFRKHYEEVLLPYLHNDKITFSLCDFRGVDTLSMELMKCSSKNVCVYHMGEKPRYLPDKFKTKVSDWTIIGGFKTDEQRDNEAIAQCTHFLAIDFNSDDKRKSGTLKNIERCLELGKIQLLMGSQVSV